MKKAQYLSFTLITLLVFIFTSCSSEEDLKIAETPKTIYLPTKIDRYNGEDWERTINLTYDSLNRLAKVETQGRDFGTVIKNYEYNEKGWITKFSYSPSIYYTVYYDEDGSIDMINRSNGTSEDWNYDPATNSYKMANSARMYGLDQNGDVIYRANSTFEDHNEYGFVKGVFSDLQRQPLFYFYPPTNSLLSAKALKKITRTSNPNLTFNFYYVLNEMGYPIESTNTSSLTETENGITTYYTYREITVN